MTPRRALVVFAVAAVVGCHHRPPPAHAPAPAPPRQPAREVCDNCLDDDGDGRVDFEDSDCCPHPAALEGTTLIVAPGEHPEDSDLFTLTTRVPAGAFTEPNPYVDDVTLQLRVGQREVGCAAIGHQFWRKTGQTYRFHPHAGHTRDLPETFVRVLPNGAVAVHATGMRKGLARLADAEWEVTVRIGDGCASGRTRPSGRH